ncbi:MAG: hypothetical protein JW748_03480 [Anaerolineales bacterium]|nr:hypothetical protein [Anaerolineales bacterium]
MNRIRVDTDLLFKHAEAIRLRADRLRKNGEILLTGILGVGGEYAELTSQARRDAYAAQETIRSIQQPLKIKADGLAALARAFRSIDDEIISALISLRGEGWFLQNFFPAPLLPDLAGFEPCFVPQAWILLSDWVPVFIKGPHGLTQTDTFHTGKILDRVIGTWSDPATGADYFVVDLGGGRFAFIPRNRKNARIDSTLIPNREGVYTDGQAVTGLDVPLPFQTGGSTPEWHAPGDPWQNLILGRMDIAGIGGGSFPMTPHGNLCGELSVLRAVGETDLEAGFTRFAQLRGLGYWNLDGAKTEYTGTQVLQNVGHTTSAYDLRRLFEDYGWDAGISHASLPAPDALAQQIHTGTEFVFLTELDTRREIFSPEIGRPVPNPSYGRLVPGAVPATPGRAAHWVVVKDVFQDGDGKIFVQVFNPYSGGEEAYSWDTFVKTCQQPGSQVAGSYTYISATPPQR